MVETPPQSENPFEVGVQSELIEPIHFQGKLTPVDGKVALWDMAPKPAIRWLGDVAITAFAMWGLVQFEGFVAEDGRPATSVIWVLGGLILFPLWHQCSRFLSPLYWRRFKRFKNLMQDPSFVRGWLAQEGVVVLDGKEFLRANWSHFQACYVFEKHLSLPATFDHFSRTIIPIRFFANVHTAERAIDFVSQRLGTIVDLSKSSKQARLAEFSQTPDRGMPDPKLWEQIRVVTYADTTQWDRTSWPFEASTTGEVVCRIVTPPVSSANRLKAWLVSFGLLPAFAWMMLPVFVGAVTWLCINYSHYGGFAFVTRRLPSTVMAFLPLLAIVWFFLRAVSGYRAAMAAVTSKDRWLHIREQGICYQEEGASLWLRKECFNRIQLEENRIAFFCKDHPVLVIPDDHMTAGESMAAIAELRRSYGSLVD